MADAAADAVAAPGRVQRSSAAIVATSVGGLCSLAAAAGFVDAADTQTATAAAILHVLAAWLAMRGTWAAGASRSEVALFAALAATLPGVGAWSAWWFCVSRAPRHASNAHAENDPLRLGSASGGADLRRELGVNSYSQVVRHGSLEQKRNLLRRLAQLGTPRHLVIVRQFLFEEEPELRLCAYAELARIGQQHEQGIGRLRCAVGDQEADGAVAEALAALAMANRAYAVSGVLDDEMAGYWSDQAEQIARQAIDLDPACSTAQRVLALVLADRGVLDESWQIITTWPTEVDKETELVRAEVAFRRHDRRACHLSLDRLEESGEGAPEWLRSTRNVEVAT